MPVEQLPLQEESSGYIQVEPMIFYGIDPNDTPHYIVRRSDDEKFFQLHIDSFDRLWNKSHTLSAA